MIGKLRRRVASGERQGGFTLIELLVVIIIIGILLAIAVPSYLGMRDRANRATTQANVRSAVPAAEAYYSDNGTYATMTLAGLQGIDSGISPDVTVGAVKDADTYCLQAVRGGFTYSYQVGGAVAANNNKVLEGACPAA